MRLTVAEIARVTGGRLVLPPGDAGDALVSAVGVDSRRAGPGHLFVAIAGERVDGHDFVDAAFRAGATAALVSRVPPGGTAAGRLIEVEAPLPALQRLAGWTRDANDPIVVGITGSTGKTSTKDLLAAVASVRYPTVAAYRSENNELGVPLTLLRATADTAVVVCELGARGPGQIRALCEFVRPSIGVVTNVGVAHYEQFGSVEAIVAAKSELPAALPAHGTAVLNADDPAVAGMAGAGPAEALTYGTDAGAWLRAEAIELDERGRAGFVLVRGNRRVGVTLGVAGRHQVHNALAAGAAGLALGLSLEEVGEGLRTAAGSPWRMEVTASGGAVIVNDAYNANPTSMAAALETCSAMVPRGGRLVAVLGAMAELGDLEVAEHRRVGRLAAQRAQRLIVVGDRARPIAEAAREAGLADVSVVGGEDPVAAALDAVGTPRAGDVILVKASRVAGLERVATGLAGEEDGR
jgi:UDP-N-acetylmuramoyl-tripeptide--D-alanyl-D-alanine ligase